MGYALQFNGANYASVQDCITGNTPRTFEFWTVVDPNQSSGFFFCGQYGPLRGSFIYHSSPGLFKFTSYAGDYTRFVPIRSVRTHRAVVYDGATVYLYDNFELIGSRLIAEGPLNTLTGPTFWGRGESNGPSVMDGMRVWTEARTPEQLQAHAHTPVVAGTPNLWAQYLLREGSGTTAHDNSGNGRHLTLENGVTWVTGNGYNPPPVAEINKGRFLFFGQAQNAATTEYLLKDESPNGYDMVAVAPDQPNIKADSTGRKVVWNVSGTTFYSYNFGNQGLKDYTIYAVLRVGNPAGTYFFDNHGHQLLLCINHGDGAYYSQQFGSKGYIGVASGELALICWRLSSQGARVYKNGTLIYSGAYLPCLLTTGRLFCDFGVKTYANFSGDLHSFAVAVGNDSDQEVAETCNYLAAKAGLGIAFSAPPPASLLPAPYDYDAAGAALNTGLATLTNKGTAGAAGDMVAGAVAPKALIGNGLGRNVPYLEFQPGGDYGNAFRTPADFPAVVGAKDRTVFVVVKTANISRGILQLGKHNYGLGNFSLYEANAFYSVSLAGADVSHVVGNSTDPTRVQPNKWQVVAVRVRHENGAATITIKVDRTPAVDYVKPTLNTELGPFMIGGDVVSNNGDTPMNLARVQLFDRALTDEEFNNQCQGMLDKYTI
jgi:hypothetical protein